MIEIVAGVREQVPEAGLHIVGTPDDRRYARRVTARARAAGFVVHEKAHLATRAPLFSAERFMREIRAAVAEAAATP